MSDHPQSIPTVPPATWEEQPVFRWLLLAHLPPALVESFAAFGDVLYDGVIEGDRLQHDPALHLRGLAADLDTAALFLDSYAESCVHEPPALGIPTLGWRDRLQALAEEIRAAVEAGGAA